MPFFKFFMSLLPFFKELIFNKELGATKGEWRRTTRIILLAGMVLFCLLGIVVHMAIQQAEQIRVLKEEIVVLQDQNKKPTLEWCHKYIEEQYVEFFTNTDPSR